MGEAPWPFDHCSSHATHFYEANDFLEQKGLFFDVWITIHFGWENTELKNLKVYAIVSMLVWVVETIFIEKHGVKNDDGIESWWNPKELFHVSHKFSKYISYKILILPKLIFVLLTTTFKNLKTYTTISMHTCLRWLRSIL